MAESRVQVVKPKQKDGTSELARREERTALWLLVPTFIVLLLIGIYPLGQVFVSSFTNQRFAGGNDSVAEFVGFQNYSNLLSMTFRQVPAETNDDGSVARGENGNIEYQNERIFLRRLETNRRYDAVGAFNLFGNRYVLGATNAAFIRATWDTLVFTVGSVFFETLLGMIIALALSVKFIGQGVMRAAMLVPWAVITVVSARIWEWMLQSTRAGFFNAFFQDMGWTQRNIGFFQDATWQIPSMIVMDVWKTTPFMALLLLAGLATIPKELYEAAKVDGASPIRQFFSITLPLLAPTLAVALIFRTLDALRVFDAFQVVLGRQRYSMASYAQDVLINQQQVGLSSAASVVIFVIIFGFAIAYTRAFGVEES